MRPVAVWLMMCICMFGAQLSAQSVDFRGSGSVYGNGIENYRFGGHFLPILEGDMLSGETPYILDAEISANTYAYYDSSREITADLSPYRCWVRFAGSQFELRAGLQKITFGQAQILRPLMWYDSIDPRDPLNMTQGKWALRARYYFPGTNNNFWFWGMREAADKSFMLIEGVHTGDEAVFSGGCRYQAEILGGETGLSGSAARYKNLVLFDSPVDLHTWKATDYRLGLDIKWDMEIGMWLEAAAVFRNSFFDHNSITYYGDSKMSTTMATLGLDYTLPLGNGIYVMAEAMLTNVTQKFSNPIIAGMAEETTVLDKQVLLTGFMAQYPLGIFDSAGMMSFVLPQNKFQHYSYLFWQREYNVITLRLSGALTNLDADEFSLFGTDAAASLGNMIQFMLVYDFKLNMI